MNMRTEGRKQAWIYCAIDAPEDIHEQLKKQYMQLYSYAEQMGFEPAGSSSDLGGKPLWQRSGFGHFIQAVREGRADTFTDYKPELFVAFHNAAGTVTGSGGRMESRSFFTDGGKYPVFVKKSVIRDEVERDWKKYWLIKLS